MNLQAVVDWLNVDSGAVTAAATVTGVVVAIVYAWVTVLLWRATKRQANIAQQMLEAGHRRYLSIDFDIAGTGERPTRDFVRLQPSFENHGAVPATVIGWRFAARDGGHLVGEQDQTRGEDVLAIFPHRKEDAKPMTVQGEDAARLWESSEFLIFEASVEYRGVYERRYATTRSSAWSSGAVCREGT